MDVEQFRKAGYQAIDRICDYYYSLQDKPVVSSVTPGYLREALPSEAPVKGEDFQNVADDYQKLIVPGLTHWQHPSFFAYFPTATTFEGILASLYANSACNPGFNYICSPACTELEAVVTDWGAKLFGLSPDFYNTSQVGGGVLQETASDSALVVLVAARSKYIEEHPGTPVEDLVIYCTTQTHSLGRKAGLVLGISVHLLPVYAEDEFGARGTTLEAAITEDLGNGKKPFAFVATVGSTSSGAIDNVEEIGQILARHPSIWLHIDLAWAGTTLACPEYREKSQLAPINKYATSLAVNFHKAGLVNFGCSALWVRDRKFLTNALDVTPPFLRSHQADEGTVIDYRNWGLALGRSFRSLKLWFVLRGYGVEGFQNYIRKTIKVGEHFANLVRAEPLFELVTPPSFSLSVFRINPHQEGVSNEELNELNRLFFRKITARTDIMLTQTDINGTFCIRLAVGAQRSENEHVERAFVVCKEVAQESLNEWKP